jgi:hypothetical protein
MIGAGKSVLVSRTREPVAGSDIISTNINGILEILSEMK